MKKQLLGLMTILTALGACQKIEVTSLSEDVTIHATIEEKDATRTVIDENNNILWSENDQIIAFMKSSYGHKYQVISSFIGKSYADFSMVSSGSGSNLSVGNSWDHNVVYYPFSENIECLKSGANYALEVNLPTEQVYVPDSFANGSMAMVAVSENNNITFNNVLGAIKLQLKGTQTVKLIKIEGKNNEKLSGAAVVTAYTDGNKPAISMASGASKSVTLNCGNGVQLNESTATEFIIALPPVLFANGFTFTVIDADGKTHTVETDKANTVFRSSLLNMPPVLLGESEGGESEGNEGEIVPVYAVKLNHVTLALPTRFSFTLTAKITPVDATDQTPEWSSDNPTAVIVDCSGVITTMSEGTANITAVAGGVSATCSITVIAPTSREPIDYNVNGVSYGKGIVIGDMIWAPVNCGYEPATSDSKGYPYGKLYQWGRKYGQGYSDVFYDDATTWEIMEGPISAIGGNKDAYSNTFFKASESPYDWTSPQNDMLWNSGTESAPVKTEYDPCPKGWRVPTYAELHKLIEHHSSWSKLDGQKGFYLSGDYTYLDNAPQVFFPAAGRLFNDNGNAEGRGNRGHYWSSKSLGNGASSLFMYYSGDVYMSNGYIERAYGHSVRCIQE